MGVSDQALTALTR